MLVSPSAGQNPVPATPPAISERASQDHVDLLRRHQDAYQIAEVAPKIRDAIEQVVKIQERKEKRSSEITAATDRLNDEQCRPVDRRKKRSRDKRGQ